MPSDLPGRISAATDALRDAERRLRELLAESQSSPRAEKVEISAELRTAFAELRQARATLAELERPTAVASLELAREALANAEADLDRALDALEVCPRAEKKWVSDAVQESFTKLEAVKDRLARVEAALADDDER